MPDASKRYLAKIYGYCERLGYSRYIAFIYNECKQGKKRELNWELTKCLIKQINVIRNMQHTVVISFSGFFCVPYTPKFPKRTSTQTDFHFGKIKRKKIFFNEKTYKNKSFLMFMESFNYLRLWMLAKNYLLCRCNLVL